MAVLRWSPTWPLHPTPRNRSPGPAIDTRDPIRARQPSPAPEISGRAPSDSRRGSRCRPRRPGAGELGQWRPRAAHQRASLPRPSTRARGNVSRQRQRRRHGHRPVRGQRGLRRRVRDSVMTRSGFWSSAAAKPVSHTATCTMGSPSAPSQLSSPSTNVDGHARLLEHLPGGGHRCVQHEGRVVADRGGGDDSSAWLQAVGLRVLLARPQHGRRPVDHARGDLESIRFDRDGRVYTIAFAPPDAQIPPPPSVERLGGVGSELGVPAEDVPDDAELGERFGQPEPADGSADTQPGSDVSEDGDDDISVGGTSSTSIDREP